MVQGALSAAFERLSDLSIAPTAADLVGPYPALAEEMFWFASVLDRTTPLFPNASRIPPDPHQKSRPPDALEHRPYACPMRAIARAT